MRSMFALVVLVATLSLRAEPRLIEPQNGAELTGGSVVAIEWAGDLGAGVEEWEAFLSVDGGRWFSTRITPHLDASVRRFTFEVPNVATGDARILLRFGDERRETEVDVPGRFTIRFDPAAVRTRIALARGDGEPARPGARGVARWVSGARDGSGLRTFAHRETSCGEAAAFVTHGTHQENAESEDGGDAVAARECAAGAAIEPDREPVRLRAAPRASDVLRISHRLNV